MGAPLEKGPGAAAGALLISHCSCAEAQELASRGKPVSPVGPLLVVALAAGRVTALAEQVRLRDEELSCA